LKKKSSKKSGKRSKKREADKGHETIINAFKKQKRRKLKEKVIKN